MQVDVADAASRRNKLLEEANSEYARLKRDPKHWKEELDERALWDRTLADGTR
jgi:hypothetical protein